MLTVASLGKAMSEDPKNKHTQFLDGPKAWCLEDILKVKELKTVWQNSKVVLLLPITPADEYKTQKFVLITYQFKIFRGWVLFSKIIKNSIGTTRTLLTTKLPSLCANIFIWNSNLKTYHFNLNYVRSNNPLLFPYMCFEENFTIPSIGYFLF